jgi:hypothetical protein
MGWFRGTACAVALALLVAGSADAKTFKPTRTDDPVPDACKPNNCSLREAVVAAAATDEKDKILLRAKRYNLELASGDAPFHADGLDVYESMVIRGRGPSHTTIDANGIDRPIEIGMGVSNDTARISFEELKLTGGDPSASTSGNGGFDVGGAIVAARPRRVTLKRVVVTGNEAAFGGGIASYADTELVIKQSTIAGNTANEGGGIDLRPGLEPSVQYESRIVASTISGNEATNKGAGILADGLPGGFEDPLLSIDNSTIARNEAANNAGGILADNQATVDVENSSIGFNVANADDVGLADGGGVFQYANASFNIDDSVIAHNEVGQGGSQRPGQRAERPSRMRRELHHAFQPLQP